MSYVPEDREPNFCPSALLRGPDGSPAIDRLGRQMPFDPRLSDASDPELVDGVWEFRACICTAPRNHEGKNVTEEQHGFIEQFEYARHLQEEAEVACAEARWAPPPPPREPEPDAIPPEGKLTPRQQEFCRHYATQPVAARAAALAGYAADHAANQGYRLLKNPLVLDRIAEWRAANGVRYVVEPDTLHDKLEAVFFEALSEGNHAAAIAALRLQAGLAGLPARPRGARAAPAAGVTRNDDPDAGNDDQ